MMVTEDNNKLFVRNFGGFSAKYGGAEIAKGTQGESQVGMLLLAGAYPEHAAVKTFAAAEAEAIKDSSTSRTD